jgi:hypothetical protein
MSSITLHAPHSLFTPPTHLHATHLPSFADLESSKRVQPVVPWRTYRVYGKRFDACNLTPKSVFIHLSTQDLLSAPQPLKIRIDTLRVAGERYPAGDTVVSAC